MKLLEHGEYVVLDGTQDELSDITETLEKSSCCGEALGRMRRGLEKGATRIALSEEWVLCVHRCLSEERVDSELVTDLEAGLERLDIEG